MPGWSLRVGRHWTNGRQELNGGQELEGQWELDILKDIDCITKWAKICELGRPRRAIKLLV
jgi:hypothetical protein